MTMKKEKRESKMRQRKFNIVTSSLFFCVKLALQSPLNEQKQSSAYYQQEIEIKQRAKLGVGLN